METLIAYFADESTLLFKWQTLFGSIIGVFGAFLVAFTLFLADLFYKKYKKIREDIRLTEIALALGYNDIIDAERNLNDFLERLNLAVIEPLQNKENTTNQFFLSKTNFPPLSIHIDSTLLKSRYRSYYVHNKILIIHKNIKKTNDMFKEMKMEYEEIISMARFLVNKEVSFGNQRRVYLDSNKSFIIFVKDVIDQLQIAKKIFIQAKIYNLKLLNKQGFSIWRLEGARFKFFCNKQEKQKYKSTLDCLDRIDKEIEPEINKLMASIEKRIKSDQTWSRKTFKECMKDRISCVIAKIQKKHTK